MKTTLGVCLALSLLTSPFLVMPTAAAAAPLSCDGHRVTQVSTDGDDTLYGTSNRDVVSLGDGDDRFEGRGGDDIVCGDNGNDTLHGGSGDDRLFGGDGDDVLEGKKGNDLVTGYIGIDRARGGGGDDEVGGYDGFVYGGPGSDVYDAELSYYPRGVRVFLGRGDDLAKMSDEWTATIFGGPGDDEFRVFYPDDGADATGYEYTTNGGEGRDLLTFRQTYRRVNVDVASGEATMGHWWVKFSKVEVFEGSNQDDIFRGSDGPDVMRALGGDDVVRGLGGRDRADGGRGTDSCRTEVRVRCERQ